MTIIRWTPRQFALRNPWRELDRLRRHFEGLYETMSDGVEAFRRGGPGVYPALNLYEDNDNLYLKAELAGVAPEDIELSVHGDSLTLRGERKIPDTEEEVNYHRREREAGIFRRVVTLPIKVDTEKVQAKAVNGILEVTLPKISEAKARQVSIQSE